MEAWTERVTSPPMGKAGDCRKEQQAYHHYQTVQQLEGYITPERDHAAPEEGVPQER